MAKSKETTTEQFERAVARQDKRHYVLRLYVSGMTPKSTRAIMNLKEVCEKHLKGRYELEVIDVYQQPKLAREGEIIAAPTLIKELPLPLRRIVGDLSDSQRVLVGLSLKEAK